jgi:molybdopterin-guanine dinucleotide biosynthesis protein A
MADVTWGAVILTGGTGARLDGADKASLSVGGRSLLDRALDAVAGADEVVVVGPAAPTARPARFVREEPAGGGPLAGTAAGVAALRPGHDRVVVLAVDMPHVTAATVDRLLLAAADVDAAWLTGEDGRRQLAGAVGPGLVPAAGEAHGVPMRSLMSAGRTIDVPALAGEADDVDTWDDVARVRGDQSPGRT